MVSVATHVCLCTEVRDSRVSSSLVAYDLLILVSPSGLGLSLSSSHEAGSLFFLGAMVSD